MDVVTRKFYALQEKHPGWSTILCFCNAVIGEHLSKLVVRRRFRLLVDKDDYLLTEAEEILNFLYTLTQWDRNP